MSLPYHNKADDRFAAEARSPANPPCGLTRKQYAKHLRDVIMAMFGIRHTKNTIVGDHFVRGVSGGEYVESQGSS